MECSPGLEPGMMDLQSIALAAWLRTLSGVAARHTFRLFLATKLVLRAGFEPAIYDVKGRCPGPLDERSEYWQGPQDSNLHHTVLETGILPIGTGACMSNSLNPAPGGTQCMGGACYFIDVRTIF